MSERFIVYTDGACSGNPGPGGWAAVVIGETEAEYSGFEPNTTNNRMELAAVLEVLQLLPDASHVDIHTDSQNVIGWLSQGWKRNDATIRIYCEAIDQYSYQHRMTLTFNKVKGHADNEWNQKVDKLAVKACKDGMAKRGI